MDFPGPRMLDLMGFLVRVVSFLFIFLGDKSKDEHSSARSRDRVRVSFSWSLNRTGAGDQTWPRTSQTGVHRGEGAAVGRWGAYVLSHSVCGYFFAIWLRRSSILFCRSVIGSSASCR
jgi:hypothetical protein